MLKGLQGRDGGLRHESKFSKTHHLNICSCDFLVSEPQTYDSHNYYNSQVYSKIKKKYVAAVYPAHRKQDVSNATLFFPMYCNCDAT